MNEISIEQIKANPNLDLSERINYFKKNPKWSNIDLEELAIASIKNEYDYWISHRTNISARTDVMLEKILNGHMLDLVEAFEMTCDDLEKVKEYSKYDNLRKRISVNSGITQEDFNNLCTIMEIDEEAKAQIFQEFQNKDLIIKKYNDEYNHHK